MSGLELRVEELCRSGRHEEAARLCEAAGDAGRAGELFAAVWCWPDAIRVTRNAGLLDRAYAHALAAGDRAQAAQLLVLLEGAPEQAVRAAVHAEAKGRTLDAARLRAAAGELELAAELFERAGELKDAARARVELGQMRAAGILYERRVREAPDDTEAALELGRILAQFGRWEHAVRALQSATREPAHEVAALKLLVACFAALGLDEAAGSRLDALREHLPGLPVSIPEALEKLFGDRRGLVALAGEGERLLAGRYRIVRSLGAGATGRVLLAHDAFYDRDVAVKVLHVGGGEAGRDAFVRFAREARVAAGIAHPNVVRVFEFNADGPFLVMEHMAGGTLEDRLHAGDRPIAITPSQTGLVVRSILAALEVVHRRGVVHRDLKPANVVFGAAGDVKIGDFGVAHLTDLGATLTGAMLGTLAYMSPEQITGSKRPDATTDLYALGVIVFRCLTGRLPFPGPDFVQQHLEQAPPVPSEVAPWLGTAFDSLIARLLSKEPSGRPASADETLDLVRELPWDRIELPAEPEIQVPASAASSRPPPAEQVERFRAIERRGQVWRAHDELLEREVLLVECGAAAAARARALCRADGPYLQSVYEVGEARVILESPRGALLSAIADPARRAQAIADVRQALERLHAEGLAHGAVDEAHVRVGPWRACLLLSLEPPSAGPDGDLEALARLAAARA
ncbi:MAG: protein kinase [Sandaracinaceae bacterium]|nr:protein kinase [Sandaracinaceae bacterium]